MGKNADTQAGGRQVKKPKAAGRKKRLVIATLGILAVGLGAWAIWHHVTQREEITLDLGNNVKMRLVLIPAGKFMMGSPDNEKNRWIEGPQDEGPQHQVIISKPFFMGVCEVTQEQYEQVMGTNPSKFKGTTNPVECVSWDDAAEFCKRLSARTGNRVTLPTEAQWEYACRAGTTTPFHTGDALRPDQANTNPNPLASPSPGAWEQFTGWIGQFFRQKARFNVPTPVGSFPPNAFGLYDMHGNVWEWCADWYAEDYYANSPKTDPEGPNSGEYRVLRGGTWSEFPGICRSACRGREVPVARGFDFGFRVAVAPGVD